jgi:hypothetical protein
MGGKKGVIRKAGERRGKTKRKRKHYPDISRLKELKSYLEILLNLSKLISDSLAESPLKCHQEIFAVISICSHVTPFTVVFSHTLHPSRDSEITTSQNMHAMNLVSCGKITIFT